MKVDGYKCDECGTEKKSTNHWFLVYADSERLKFVLWDSEKAAGSGVDHLCGHGCAQKVLEHWMSGK